MIERVKQFGVELYGVTLCEMKVLCKIDVPVIRAAAPNYALTGVPETSRRGILNRLGIEPPVDSAVSTTQIRIAYYIRTGASVLHVEVSRSQVSAEYAVQIGATCHPPNNSRAIIGPVRKIGGS